MEYIFLLLGVLALMNGIPKLKSTDHKTKSRGKLLILGSIGIFACSILVFNL